MFHYYLLFLNISYYFTFTSKSQSFFIKFTITNILILILWTFKNQLILQFPSPLIIKVIVEILFVVRMTSLFLPKYKCCMNERFLSKLSIKSNGNVISIVELLILSLILNKLLKRNKFNCSIMWVLIILFVVSTWQTLNQNNFFISSIKEFFYCYLDTTR